MSERLAWWGLKARAATLLLIGRPRDAEVVFGRMLQRFAGDPYALASRAHVRAQLGRRAEAIDDARALVTAYPRRSAADWFNLGYLLDAEGRAAEAEPAFRQALALDERLDQAWYGLGLALIRLGRLDDAVAALKRNTELQPMSPYGWYQLARVHADRQDHDAARHVIRHLVGFEPKVALQLQRETGLTP